MTPLAAAAAAACDETSSALRAAYTLGAKAWPSLRVTYEQFQSQATQANGGRAMAPSHAEDFYLGVACANADALAHEALEARHFPVLRQVVQALVTDGAAVDDILQELRMRLLAGPAPKLATFRGRGALGSWLRKVTLHAARDYCREKKVERRRQRVLSLEQESQTREEPDVMARSNADARREEECEQAWSKAMRGVDSADLHLLHRRFALGMSIDALSPVYAVHRATIARRVHRALQRVRRTVRDALAAQHRGLAPRELDAMLREWSSARETPLQEL